MSAIENIIHLYLVLTFTNRRLIILLIYPFITDYVSSLFNPLTFALTILFISVQANPLLAIFFSFIKHKIPPVDKPASDFYFSSITVVAFVFTDLTYYYIHSFSVLIQHLFYCSSAQLLLFPLYHTTIISSPTVQANFLAYHQQVTQCPR